MLSRRSLLGSSILIAIDDPPPRPPSNHHHHHHRARCAKVRIISDGQPLAGQFGAFARADNPASLPVGYLLPFAGRVVADGRHAFELELGAWQQSEVVIDPDPRCSGTYVNDAFGPDRAARRRAQQGRSSAARQNVGFHMARDHSGFPHAFWRVLRPIPPGVQLLGDYGEEYWSEGDQPRGSQPLVDTEVRHMLTQPPSHQET